jgi:hypothetical protein
MNIDMFPVIDCSNLKQYFDTAKIPLVSIGKFRGNLNYAEGVCNGDVKFLIKFEDDTHISIRAGNISRVVEVNEHTYPL